MSDVGMPASGNDPNVQDLSVNQPQESKPTDQLLPDIENPVKPFELREAIMRKPSNRPLVRKIANPYPTISKIVGGVVEKVQSPEGEIIFKEKDGDVMVSIGGHDYMYIQEARIENLDVPNIVNWVEETYYDQQPPYEVSHHWGHAWAKKEQQAENRYPAVSRVLADLVEEKDNLARLEISTPDEFGVKYKGKLDQLAEEHDLGDLIGYALLPNHIMIWGSENCMELSYSLEEPSINQVYYFDVGPEGGEAVEIEEVPETEAPEEQ